MAISWPGGLPTEPLLAWSEKFQALALRSPTDTGPAKLRRRTTSGPRKIQVPFALTEAQAAVLDTFYHTTTANGVLRFEWTHPRTGVPNLEFRFLDAPELIEEHRGLYRTTLSLELLP